MPRGRQWQVSPHRYGKQRPTNRNGHALLESKSDQESAPGPATVVSRCAEGLIADPTRELHPQPLPLVGTGWSPIGGGCRG